jgi:hypothetical protein
MGPALVSPLSRYYGPNDFDPAQPLELVEKPDKGELLTVFQGQVAQALDRVRRIDISNVTHDR